MSTPYTPTDADRIEPEFYRHTGTVPLLGLLLILVIGSITAALLGVAYTYGIVWIPFIYVCFLLTGGFGAAVGGVVGLLARFGHVRNSLATGLLGCLCALVGLYVAWAVDDYARAAGGHQPSLRFNPSDLLWYMGEFYNEGYWGLSGNTMISGPFLAVLWVIEALVICGIAAFLAAGMIVDRVYCETCRRWIPTREDVYRVSLAEAEGENLKQCLEDDVRMLANMKRAMPEDQAYIQLDLTSCPGCEHSHYLSAKAVAHVPNKEGKVEKKEEALMGHRQVLAEDIAYVQQRGASPAMTFPSNPQPSAPRLQKPPGGEPPA